MHFLFLQLFFYDWLIFNQSVNSISLTLYLIGYDRASVINKWGKCSAWYRNCIAVTCVLKYEARTVITVTDFISTVLAMNLSRGWTFIIFVK